MAESYSLRSRQVDQMAGDGHEANGSPFRPTRARGSASTRRNSPYLPTPLESLALLIYPVLLVFGSLFSVLSPETRASPYDVTGHSHVQTGNAVPSYFARKDNLLNIIFVKRGWAWITVAFVAFAASHSTFRSSGTRLARAASRWALITGWWILVTQWCFGPAIIDRGFRFTGGKCEDAHEAVFEGTADKSDVFTAAACKASGGRWSGGHDISGHVFLLVLGSYFLVQEVGWVLLRSGAGVAGRGEERAVVMGDGAVKGAGVEAEGDGGAGDGSALGVGSKFTLTIVGLCWWMLLMTAIYFHTWFEKLTGLLVAFLGVYAVYILPRWIPALRGLIGMPGM
ncbi:Uu.00g003940.m01.CDS01 [Anthostomella pinea]|uniref:Acyl-coenzyme A diphosphatase SCS3 n=1 Tax=Anthostomella pinea TaxID=933095 RepID=A0AAI8VJS3_9PEZI|nr:Uu.00g003940.m01.CDS01 [Anthostomella pinea]